MLDEETVLPKGTDDTFLQKLHQTHDKKQEYVRPVKLKSSFVIKHYAGDV
jgi:myosin heavy subunit